jgi:hypothetical protein
MRRLQVIIAAVVIIVALLIAVSALASGGSPGSVDVTSPVTGQPSPGP